MKRSLCLIPFCAAALGACTPLSDVRLAGSEGVIVNQGNPLFRDRHTADPAPLVVGDTLYLYVGHDEARGDQLFNITEWLV